MNALTGLVGAVIGGLLVLAGDYVRQRSEWNRTNVRNLAEAAANFAAIYNRRVAEVWNDRSEGLAEPRRPDPERLERLTRFFMTPGAEKLRAEAKALVDTLDAVHDSFHGTDEEFSAAIKERLAALIAFESAVRDLTRSGSL
jgi:cytochrome c-type biogenesis protein CcmH/NrfG